mmetsp:Transcript_13511/g.34478  ORF Transcript_13511/g.34478 Transcript_13511/m.34478 type:complete len:222 (+) Transcript_13511:4884-5549(+)
MHPGPRLIEESNRFLDKRLSIGHINIICHRRSYSAKLTRLFLNGNIILSNHKHCLQLGMRFDFVCDLLVGKGLFNVKGFEYITDQRLTWMGFMNLFNNLSLDTFRLTETTAHFGPGTRWGLTTRGGGGHLASSSRCGHIQIATRWGGGGGWVIVRIRRVTLILIVPWVQVCSWISHDDLCWVGFGVDTRNRDETLTNENKEAADKRRRRRNEDNNDETKDQ